MQEPQRRLIGNAERDHAEDDGAGERGEFPELAGAEREARIVHMPAREQISEPGDGERGDMRSHVPAVGDERDGSVQHTAGNLGDHHDRGKRNHGPGSPLVRAVMLAEEGVIVRPGRHRLRIHAATPSE